MHIFKSRAEQTVCVLLVLFVVLVILTVWAWCRPDPRKAAFDALRAEVLGLENPSVYPLDILPTPASFSGSEKTIPRIVHYVGSQTNALLRRTHLNLWTNKHYTPDQQHNFVKSYFADTWPDIWHAYNLCHSLDMQLDIFKYLVVYHFGGLYIDSNVKTNKPLDTVLTSAKALVSYYTPPTSTELFGNMTQGNGECQSWWVAAPQHDLFLWQVIWQVVRNVFVLHTKSRNQCNFALLSEKVRESATNGILYTYMAAKFKHLVTVWDNDALELAHAASPTQRVDSQSVHLVYVQDKKAVTQATTTHKIPAIIHQTHESRWVTPAMAQAMKRIQAHAPSCEYRFYDNKERRDFIAKHYATALKAYDALVPGAYRADLFRAIVVYTLGGVYFDAGFSPFKGVNLFEDVIDKRAELVFPIDVWIQGLGNGVFASTQGHTYLKLIIDHIVDNVGKRRTFTKHKGGFLQITGPKAYADALQHVLPNPLKEGMHNSNLQLLYYPTGDVVFRQSKPLYSTHYLNYYQEQQTLIKHVPHYIKLWEAGQVYSDSVTRGLKTLLDLPAPRWPVHLPVFYINLDRAVARNLKTMQELGKVSSNVTRVSAIDGAALVQHVKITNDFKSLSPCEVGCTASHLKAIKMAFDLGLEKAIICEDDASFAPMRIWEQNEIDAFVESIPNDVGIVLLCWGEHKYGELLQIDVVHSLGGLFSMVAYIITKRGMADILGHAEVSDKVIQLRKTSYVPQGVADGYLYSLTKVATSLVPLALPDNMLNKTQIQDRKGDYDHDASHFNLLGTILEHVLYVKQERAKSNVDYTTVCQQPYDMVKFLDYMHSNLTRQWPPSLPVFYINLDRSNDRRQALEAVLTEIGANSERVQAFDGRLLNSKTNTIQGVQVTSDFPNLTQGELGCTASHLCAIKRAFDRGYEYALICEDDVSFASLCVWEQDAINSFLKSIQPTIGIVLLFWYGRPYGTSLKLTSVDPINADLYSTCAYIITRYGMKQVLAHAHVSQTKIHWNKTFAKQLGQADEFLFSITSVATSGAPLLLADNTNVKQTITDRASDHEAYQSKEFEKAVRALHAVVCSSVKPT